MKYCSKCGNQLVDEAVICPKCGCGVKTNTQVNNQQHENDKVNAGLIIASILLPIVGVILWPVKHKTQPNSARVYGIVGIISWAVFGILFAMMGGL